MKKEDILDAIGRIDRDLIEETDSLRQKTGKKAVWLRWAAGAAACVALTAALWIGLIRPRQNENREEMLSGSVQEGQTQVSVEQAPIDLGERLQLLNFSAEETEESADPSVEPYNVSPDLSEVINLDMLYLSEEQKVLLAENLFVVSPSYSNEFFETYEYNRYAQIPNFVTVDSLMHTYHLYFSLLLNQTEKQYLAAQLAELSQAMLETSMAQYETLIGTQWEDAARRNVAYFAVAARLQRSDLQIPDYAAQMAEQELEMIFAAEGIVQSPLAEDLMDYSQFLPRGYYEGDDTLEAYFRAMMWYGQVNFSQDNDSLNRSALLMTLAMMETDISAWERIYTVTAFFSGVSDDLGYYEYAPAIVEAYGTLPAASDLPEQEQAYTRFLTLAESMRLPAINSVPTSRYAEGELGELNKGFRFMGQRFTIDAAVMQQLVYRAVGENSTGQLRMLPDTLDMAAAMGSDTALDLLEQQGATDYAGYPEHMADLREILSDAPEASWTSSLYSGWLYTLQPLLQEKGAGYPSFMTSQEWQKKNLETFAGSFTELKHDTVLYAKQVMAEMGGGPSEVLDDRGYVEPEPEVFRRFMLLARQTAQGLDALGLLQTEDLENLGRLEELSRRLMVIANKELQNETLTDEEYDLIRDYGGTLEHFWIEAVEDRTDADYLDPAEIPAALVTDIATDPNGSVLQIANGKPGEILVIVPVDGTLRIASGAVYNYYQFEHPISQRLTDTTWRQMIGQWRMEDGSFNWDAQIDKPWWTESYRAK